MNACEQCRYWMPDEPEDHIGECHRYPPTLIGGETLRDDEEQPGFDPMDPEQLMLRSCWPVTSKVSTCGEFMPKVRLS